MGLLPRFFRRSPSVEERAMTVAPAGLELTLPYSGERVSPSTCDQNTAVGRAIQLISNDLAKVPRTLMRRTANGAEPDTSSALWRLFDTSPNVEQSGFEFWRYMTAMYLRYGNAVALIQKNLRGDTLQLIPLDPQSISIEIDQKTGNFFYNHAEMGLLEPEEIFHLKFGLTDESGIWGLSPVVRGREALGLAKAQEKAGASSYRNSASPSMALRHPGTLSDKAGARLTEQFSKAHAGPESAGKAILLEEGMDVTLMNGLSLESQQWIDARRFSIGEVSRIYGVPAPYLSDNSNSTYSNVTELVRMYTNGCLSHHAAIWAAEIQFKLLAPDQYIDIDLTYVQRGSFTDEISALNQAVTSGIMTPNECRHRLGLNPLEGLDAPRLRLDTGVVNQEDENDDRNPFDTDE